MLRFHAVTRADQTMGELRLLAVHHARPSRNPRLFSPGTPGKQVRFSGWRLGCSAHEPIGRRRDLDCRFGEVSSSSRHLLSRSALVLLCSCALVYTRIISLNSHSTEQAAQRNDLVGNGRLDSQFPGAKQIECAEILLHLAESGCLGPTASGDTGYP